MDPQKADTPAPPAASPAPIGPQLDFPRIAQSYRALADEMEHCTNIPAFDGGAAILAAINAMRIAMETRMDTMERRLDTMEHTLITALVCSFTISQLRVQSG